MPSPQQIVELALESSSLTPEQVGLLPLITRFAQQDVAWELKKPIPGPPGAIVFSIFEGEQHDSLGNHLRGDVRIYCVPDPSMPGVGAPYCMFLLSRVGPTLVRTDYASAELFAAEIASEWDDLATALDLLDEEDEEDEAILCNACGLETNVGYVSDDPDDPTEDPPAKFCGNCGVKFSEEIAVTQ